MDRLRVRIGTNGRFVIPLEYRRALGVSEGDEVFVRFVEGEMRVSTVDTGIKYAQSLVRRYVPEDSHLVDELIQERRDSAEKEL